MRTTLLAVAALTLFACGGPGSFSGTVTSIPLAVKSSVFLQQRDSSGKATTAVIALTDVDAPCDELKANRMPKNGTIVTFTLVNLDSNHAQIAADVGDYTVTDNVVNFLTLTGDVGLSTFEKYDTNCTNTIQSKNADAKSGLIKVTGFKAETGGSASGTFDVTYGDQADKVTGSFDAPFCDAQITNSPSCE